MFRRVTQQTWRHPQRRGSEMPGGSTRGTFRVEVGARPNFTGESAADRPLHIVLLGAFSGQSNRGDGAARVPIAERTPITIDRDNFDEVMARVAPTLALAWPGEPESSITLQFAGIDDFHPDQLYQRLPSFKALRLARDQLADPHAIPDSVTDLLPEKPIASPKPPAPADLAAPGDLLDQIVGQASGEAAVLDPVGSDLDDYIRGIVAPHLIPRDHPGQAKLLEAVDAQVVAQMRRLLHHTDYQALEALWRGVFFLCRRLETGATLKLYVVDVSKQDLSADQAPEIDLQESGLYRLLVESTVGTPGVVPWGLLVGCYSFGPDMADVKLVGRLAAIARLAGAPWVSAAEPSLVGAASFRGMPDPREWGREEDTAWDALRLLPQASSLGLVLPRFLLRLPYGAATDACELLDFEEMSLPLEHEEYLWGNPALLVAFLAADRAAGGRDDTPIGARLEVGGLPLHVFDSKGDPTLQPCAEASFTERAAEAVMDRGIMPLLWVKDTDRVRLARLQSVADPTTQLARGWL